MIKGSMVSIRWPFLLDKMTHQFFLLGTFKIRLQSRPSMIWFIQVICRESVLLSLVNTFNLQITWRNFILQNGQLYNGKYGQFTQSGSVISNSRLPQSYFVQTFNFRLGRFVSKQWNFMACKQPLLELKTRPSFCPVGWSLSMALRHSA